MASAGPVFPCDATKLRGRVDVAAVGDCKPQGQAADATESGVNPSDSTPPHFFDRCPLQA